MLQDPGNVLWQRDLSMGGRCSCGRPVDRGPKAGSDAGLLTEDLLAEEPTSRCWSLLRLALVPPFLCESCLAAFGGESLSPPGPNCCGLS